MAPFLSCLGRLKISIAKRARCDRSICWREADFPLIIAVCLHQITSVWRKTRPELHFSHPTTRLSFGVWIQCGDGSETYTS